ncbi:MbtH family NRPS accessory protein [Streptomyces sp. NPDC048629]|uniref:MbtH family NRPS accessory protein n=1 Tax=Streptomyces sp. NPDC048629 TaxID=3154824 RepID=UPI00341CF908
MRVAIESADGTMHLMENGEDQYCLWPSGVAMPEGWRPVLGTTQRMEFLRTLEKEMDGLMPVTFVKQSDLPQYSA